MAYPHSWVHGVPNGVFDSDHDLDVLEDLADSLDRDLPVLGKKDRADIGKTLDDVRSALTDDDSLPLPLRRHLHGVLRHASNCLEEYDLYGDFELHTALDRLLVSVNADGKASKDPGRWQKIKENLIYPVMLAWLCSYLEALRTSAKSCRSLKAPPRASYDRGSLPESGVVLDRLGNAEQLFLDPVTDAARRVRGSRHGWQEAGVLAAPVPLLAAFDPLDNLLGVSHRSPAGGIHPSAMRPRRPPARSHRT